MNGFVVCKTCNTGRFQSKAWSWIPEGFKESKHFAQCPLCKKPMYLMRGINPITELSYPKDSEVKAGLMSQKGY